MTMITHNGITYHLGKLSPDPLKRAAFRPSTDVAPVIPRTQWAEIDRRSLFGDQFMLDQKSHGSCVGFSAAGCMMRIRALEGYSFQRLSGAYIYSKINGGQDNGAIISDALDELMKNGTCLEIEAPWDAIYPNRYPSSANTTATRFKVLEGYRADTFDEIVSALQLGFIAACAVQVGNNFMNLNSAGVAGWDAGGGNHAVCVCGVHQLSSGEWVLDLHNSWGLNWGQNGCCYITERHIQTVQQDSYILRVAVPDPQDPNKPPATS